MSERVQGCWEQSCPTLARTLGLVLLTVGFKWRTFEFDRFARDLCTPETPYLPVRFFDVEFVYGPDKAKEILKTLQQSEAIQRLYWQTQLTLDIAFPLLYAYSLYQVAELLQRPVSKCWVKRLAIVAGGADIVENVLSVILVNGSETPYWLLATAGGGATLAKYSALITAGLVLLVQSRWLQRAYVARLSLLALALVYFVFPSSTLPTIRNFGVLEGTSEQFWAPACAVIVAGVLLTTLQLCWRNALTRLNLLEPHSAMEPAGWWKCLLGCWHQAAKGRRWVVHLAFLGASLLMCIPTLRWLDAMNDVQWVYVFGGAGAGCLVSITSIGIGGSRLAERVQEWARTFAERCLTRLGYEPPTGYGDRRQHWRAGLVVLCFGVVLFVLYCATEPGGWRFPTISYVALLVGAFAAALSGVSFFADRHRVPTILIAVVVGSVMSNLFKRDHTFELTRAVVSKRPSFEEHFEKRFTDGAEMEDRRKPVIVVATSGGGIQAAAWTSHVFAQLELRFGERFRDSIALVSGASGGSVGTYFWLEATRPRLGLPSPEGAIKAHCAARASSLQATAWGLTFTDTLALWDKRDRAWAMEQAWLANLKDIVEVDSKRTDGVCAKHGLSCLGEWSELAAEGAVPGVMFNTTLVENAELLGLSNLDWAARSQLELGNTSSSGLQRTPFHSLESTYEWSDERKHDCGASCEERSKQGEMHEAQADASMPGVSRLWEISTVTAARLSATFPYVTPVSHPRDCGEKCERYHVADGGYFDNQGVVAAATYVSALANAGKLAGRRVVILRIESFPESEAPPVLADGLATQSIAPLQTIIGARTTTQNRRSNVELDLLEDLLDQRHIQYTEVTFQPPPKLPDAQGAPLSWQLDGCSLDRLNEDFETSWSHNRHQLENALWSARETEPITCTNSEPRCKSEDNPEQRESACSDGREPDATE